ncbi:MAG: hypothetical protein CVU38_09255 [Chloroflexi bacterium HGW-Chloroflexi-1]|nr:MAG: hypothetical protein CVU38_09255 [Chloroflexi bacterium HGW-Chloroflexi-1]
MVYSVTFIDSPRVRPRPSLFGSWRDDMAKRAQLPKDARLARKAKGATRKSSNSWLLFGVIAAVLVVVIGIVFLQMQFVRKPIEVSGRVGEGLAWGPSDATVQIVGYSNFVCGHCADFALNQGRQLRAEYEATGKVRFEFKAANVANEANAANAANAAECAADQGRFWDYHDLLFSQQGVKADPFNKASLKDYGARLELDAAQFKQCIDSDRHLEKVYRDAAEGRGQGVNYTPTFFINGQKVEGAIPYVDFKAKVEAALASRD